VGAQTTVSTDTLWPVVQRLLRNEKISSSDKQRLRNLDLGSGGFQTRTNFYEDSNSYQGFSSPIFPDSLIIASVDSPAFARSHQVGPNSTLWPQLTFADWSTLVTSGTTAIARTVPNNPVAGLLRALGELREGIPHIPLKALRHGSFRPGDTGDEFLNLVFGWIPTIKDAVDIANAANNADRIIEAFLKEAGKNIFRRYQFPTLSTTTITQAPQDATYLPVGPTQAYFSGGKYTGKRTVFRTTEKRIWFEGVYTYYADAGKTAWEREKYFLDLSDKVLGTELTPDTVYQLTGWSWLAEWVWNLGDVMKNLSAFNKDGLVMRRGYIMEEDSIVDHHILQGSIPGPCWQKFGTKSKVRLKATPYGFGFDWDGVTPFQTAILAALGISRFGR